VNKKGKQIPVKGFSLPHFAKNKEKGV